MTYDNLGSLNTQSFGQNVYTLEEALVKVPLDKEVMFRLKRAPKA
jgi:hypothetical protein